MTLDAGTRSGWPEKRSRRSTLVAQFGGDRADLLEWALNAGDPLADAVTARLFEDPALIRAQLDAGLKDGLASVQNADPTVVALLADAEQHTASVDDAFFTLTAWRAERLLGYGLTCLETAQIFKV